MVRERIRIRRCAPDLGFCLRLVAAFSAVYLIWGSTYLAIRLAIDTLPPFSMAGFRFLLAAGQRLPSASTGVAQPLSVA
jgi:drug/metabolite transporter (DMT)-like permease